MSYWIIRTFKDREAVGVLTDDELSDNNGDVIQDGSIIENSQGVHIGRVNLQIDGTILVSKRNNAWPPKFIPAFLIEPVSESEYQTYKTFDLFEI